MQTRMQACVIGESVIQVFRSATSIRGAWLVLPMLALAACGGVGGNRSPVVSPVVALPPPRAADPLAAFVARAQVGQQEMVAPRDGAAPVVVRVERSYFSGSGRNCRELSLGGGMGRRSAIYCEDPRTGWNETRALLRGGAVGRP
jgi:hypothetical protein